MNLVESIDALLEAKRLTSDVIEKLRPNDTVIVYHATIEKHAKAFLSGIDTTQTMPRQYGGPRHAGLFVSPTFEATRSFQGHGHIVFEFETKVKNLHGTDYNGRTRKKQEKAGVDFSVWDQKYPDSFRPYLSKTLSTGEVQALHLGVIRPKDIKRVYFNGDWLSPKEFAERTGTASGMDLSNPRMSLDDYIKASEFRDRKHALGYLPIWLLRFKDENELAYALTYYDDESMLIGGATLGKLAAKSVAREMWPLRSTDR